MAESDGKVLSNSLLYWKTRRDLLGELFTSGLEPLSFLVLERLSADDLKACQLVSKLWHGLTQRLWDHKELTSMGRIWSKGGRPTCRSFECHRDRSVCTVSSLAADEAAVACALGGSGRIEVWERRTLTPRWFAHAHDEGVYSVDMNADAVASGGDDAMVRLWRRRDGQLLHTLDHHEYMVWNVKLFFGELFTASYDCSIAYVSLADPANPVVRKRIKGPLCWSEGFGSDSRGRYLCSSKDFEHDAFDVGVWDLTLAVESENGDAFEASNSPTVSLKGHTDEVHCVKVCAPAADMVVSGGADATVRLWTLSTGACLRVLGGHEGKVWAVDADRYRVVAGGRLGEVRVWNLDGEESEGTRVRVPHGRATAVGQVRLDGATLLTADGLGMVVLADFWRCEPFVCGCGKKTAV